MKAVIQRVTRASVEVEGQIISSIGKGFLLLLGVEIGDTTADAEYLAEKTLHLRVFADEAGKMNLSLQDIGGALLAVSNFTLCGDCRKGRRPGFDNAAKPPEAEKLYETFVDACRRSGAEVQTGIFGAHMRLDLQNDGPVTLLLESKKGNMNNTPERKG